LNLADPKRVARVEPAADTSLHSLLRAETAAAHARLHQHSGFAAAAAGRIDRPGYQRLLLRLYGFYLALEAAAGIEPLRSGWLASDLAVLSTPQVRFAATGCCTMLPALDSPAALLGAMYVVEGSALGGRGLARSLQPLLGGDTLAGRRFFASDGADTGRAWRAFLARLTAVQAISRPVVIGAAVATFCSFETWMADWESSENA
jgi:heme oxygenase